eukprot:TRINITY_DN5064_c0_g1_i4.p1 TRINITY_DN5064_c0_g1~~TRINITY_DN5064_c0_g1_i4.p1  ORF type:complete len:174 (-),score=17.97 TRINITY_DN5064_c0_g1_i4:17-538(-)
MCDFVVPAQPSENIFPIKRPQDDNKLIEAGVTASVNPLNTNQPKTTLPSAFIACEGGISRSIKLSRTQLDTDELLKADNSNETQDNTDALEPLNNDVASSGFQSRDVPGKYEKLVDRSPKDKKEMTSLCKMRGGNLDPGSYEHISCVQVMSMSPTRGDGFAYLHTYRQKKHQN